MILEVESLSSDTVIPFVLSFTIWSSVAVAFPPFAVKTQSEQRVSIERGMQIGSIEHPEKDSSSIRLNLDSLSKGIVTQ
jgi:hypothetical protein